MCIIAVKALNNEFNRKLKKKKKGKREVLPLIYVNLARSKF